MNFLMLMIERISPSIEAIIWYRIMTNMLERKYSKRYYVIAAMLISVLLFLKTAIFSIPSLSNYRVIGSFFTTTYTFVVGILLFKNTFFEKFIWWGIYDIGVIMMELIAIVVVPAFSGITLKELQMNKSINLWVTVSTKIAALFAFELLIRIRKGRLQINNKSYKNLKLLVAFNIILFLGCVLVYYNLFNTQVNIETLVMLFFSVVIITTLVTFTLVFQIEKESKKEIQTKLKLAQIEMELERNNDMITITDNLRKLRHDMNNHIGLIKTLAHSNRFDELKEYVDQLYEDVDQANEFIILENKALAVLLNAKRNKAKKLNVDFQSVIATSDINMLDKDICALFGNILDNAIEAAEKAASKKYVDLTIQKTDRGCVISCENSFSEKPIMKRGKFVSKKGNSVLHGIGTENIKDIVSKYNGEVHFNFDDEVFNLRIIMPV
jgi:two-component system sensor histidine kinase AgrC